MPVLISGWPPVHGSLACAAHDAELVRIGEGGQVILAECCPGLSIWKCQPDVTRHQVIAVLHLRCRKMNITMHPGDRMSQLCNSVLSPHL